VFLTTNHPELIDEAAIRSGRVDFRLELGLCDASQLERMFLKFFDDAAAAARFAREVAPDRWSPRKCRSGYSRHGALTRRSRCFARCRPGRQPSRAPPESLAHRAFL